MKHIHVWKSSEMMQMCTTSPVGIWQWLLIGIGAKTHEITWLYPVNFTNVMELTITSLDGQKQPPSVNFCSEPHGTGDWRLGVSHTQIHFFICLINECLLLGINYTKIKKIQFPLLGGHIWISRGCKWHSLSHRVVINF